MYVIRDWGLKLTSWAPPVLTLHVHVHVVGNGRCW